MARLAPFDVAVGRQFRIRESVHTILGVKPNSPLLEMKRRGDPETTILMTRAELATLIVVEEAEPMDELEDPESRPTREVTNLSLLPAFRLHDWFTVIFLIRRMVAFSGHSPRSPLFRAAFQQASQALADYRLLSGVPGGRLYSAWSIYNMLVRWRASRYELSALQRRGFEYCPWKARDPVKAEGKRFTNEYFKENPLASIADAHQAANEHLNEWTSSRVARMSPPNPG